MSSSSFTIIDATFKNYQLGKIDAAQFLSEIQKEVKEGQLADWVSAKLVENRECQSEERAILEKLAVELEPHNRQVSEQITQLFRRIKGQVVETQPADPTSRLKKYLNSSTDSMQLLSLISKEHGNLSTFIDWAVANVLSAEQLDPLHEIFRRLTAKEVQAYSELVNFAIELIRNYPPAQREELYKCICKYQDQHPKDAEDKLTNRLLILRVLQRFPEDKRVAAWKLVESVGKFVTKSDDIIRLLLYMLVMRFEDCPEIFTQTAMLYRTLPAYGNLLDVIKQFGRIRPIQEIAEVRKYVEQFCKGRSFYPAFIQSVGQIPSQRREEVYKQVIRHLGVSAGTSDMGEFIVIFTTMPTDLLEDVLTVSEPYCKTVSRRYSYTTGLLIDTFRSIPKKEWPEILKHVDRIYKNSISIIDLSCIIALLGAVNSDQRADCVARFASLINGRFSPQAVGNIADFANHKLRLIPPQLRFQVIQTIQESPNISDPVAYKVLFYNLLKQDPSLRQKTLDYLFEILEKITDQDEAMRLALLASENFDSLGISEGHPIFEKVIQIIIMNDPATRNNRKNPFRLYSQLRETLQKEKPIDVPLQAVPIAGQNVCVNLNGFRERASKTQLRVKDLPKGINPNTFDTLFDTLEGRLQALNAAKQAEALDYIQKLTGNSLQTCRNNLVAKPFIKRLMHISGHPDEPVEVAAFYLHTIVKALNDQSNAVKQGCCLSDQEQFLVRMSALISDCDTGQRDGICEYYHSKLPATYKIVGLKVDSAREEKARCVLDLAVQELLQLCLASPEFLQALTGLNEIPQESHVTLYLKNRYHLQIGLLERLVFDRHSEVLIDEILDIPPQEVIHVLFQHMPPALVEKVKDKVADLLNVDNHLYMSLSEFFEVCAYVEGWQHKYIKFDEETMKPLGLTDEGALAALKAAGYLIERPSTDAEATKVTSKSSK